MRDSAKCGVIPDFVSLLGVVDILESIDHDGHFPILVWVLIKKERKVSFQSYNRGAKGPG